MTPGDHPLRRALEDDFNRTTSFLLAEGWSNTEIATLISLPADRPARLAALLGLRDAARCLCISKSKLHRILNEHARHLHATTELQRKAPGMNPAIEKLIGENPGTSPTWLQRLLVADAVDRNTEQLRRIADALESLRRVPR